jgi:hypothetical protein
MTDWLALDLGITFGWARSNGRSGSCDLRRFDDHGEALAWFQDWIDAMLDEAPRCTGLVTERGFGGNNAVGRLTTAMELTAQAAAYSRKLRRTDRSAGQVRKALLGFANISPKVEPSKARRVKLLDKAVLVAVEARGFLPCDEHAADGAALLCCVEERPILALT